MDRSASPEDNSRQPSRPTPELLARWLLAADVGVRPSSETLAAAGERAYLQLRAHLAVLLGTTGFDALWARAMHLAQPNFRAGDDTAVVESFSMHASGLHAVVCISDPAVVQQNLIVAFASFITLLCTFIGAELGARFICQLWPDLPPDAAESRAEGATP